MREIDLIFRDFPSNFSKTRFRQKSDFYTLFLVIDSFVSEGRSVKGKNLEYLHRDLEVLQEYIRPESHIEICREYAIKCVSQANSISSRKWRHRFLRAILAGTYVGGLRDTEYARVIYKLVEDLHAPDPWGFCPVPRFECPFCYREISEDFSDSVLSWRREDNVNQIANAVWLHRSCGEELQSIFLVLDRPSDG